MGKANNGCSINGGQDRLSISDYDTRCTLNRGSPCSRDPAGTRSTREWISQERENGSN